MDFVLLYEIQQENPWNDFGGSICLTDCYLKGHHFNSHFFLRLFFFLVEEPSMVSLNVEVFMKIDSFFFFNILGGSSCI